MHQKRRQRSVADHVSVEVEQRLGFPDDAVSIQAVAGHAPVQPVTRRFDGRYVQTLAEAAVLQQGLHPFHGLRRGQDEHLPLPAAVLDQR